MNNKNRYLTSQIQQDLNRKMVFVGGPRQVGKTTIAKKIIRENAGVYLNWDIAADHDAILRHEIPDAPMWGFDELHKYTQWRNFIKGLFDQFGDTKKILVTGSARLDYYRFGGDSLQGRYHYLRLNPLSAAELNLNTFKELNDLLVLGGFPEPYFAASEIEARRWSREYRARLIQEDLISLEHVRDLGKLELLMLRLPVLVGSSLSVNSLREDLQVAHKTVSHWLDIFERLYAIFRVPPFGPPQLRAVKKEQKHYHYDWTLVEDLGARFENMIAVHLLKWVQYLEDTQARDLSLRYFRDVDKREVDFVICESGKPMIAVECKWGDANIGNGLKYFKKHFPQCAAWQISMDGKKDYVSREGIRVCHAIKFLCDLV